jgi:hypothetical protein
MLALTDAQLARLAIAATAVRQRRRRQWLKDVWARCSHCAGRVSYGDD